MLVYSQPSCAIELRGTYLRFSFASRRVIITPDYSALNWREQPYGAAAQEEDEAEDYAALAALRDSTAW
ncbi:hypothetical protein WM26_24765 [Burkholderia cepacia]|nr:hypothetical protein WM26_24765 [Burkholderia cepacia]